ncbi:MAG: hypothetical protein ACYC63_00530 [Armatimonadota bacterium]
MQELLRRLVRQGRGTSEMASRLATLDRQHEGRQLGHSPEVNTPSSVAATCPDVFGQIESPDEITPANVHGRELLASVGHAASWLRRQLDEDLIPPQPFSLGAGVTVSNPRQAVEATLAELDRIDRVLAAGSGSRPSLDSYHTVLRRRLLQMYECIAGRLGVTLIGRTSAAHNAAESATRLSARTLAADGAG